MTKKSKYFLVLIVLLLFLSISVVSASDNTTTTNKTTQSLTKTTQSLTKTTPHLEKVATSTEEKQIQKEIKNINNTVKEKINKKTTTQNTKTETIIINYTTLHNTLTSPSSEDVTINIQSNITLNGTTTVNSTIKTLTINGNHHTINGNQKQFLKIQNGTTANINNITITNCTATEGGAI